ncbi:MAG TPA: ABC transporter permease subunit [Gaiellaceae bacterium]|nr:ABC transporter permease subunit [Gaiellaceae bacterium]
MLLGSFRTEEGSFTTHFVSQIFHEPYRSAYVTSIKISLYTAVLGGILGLLVAYAALSPRGPRFIRPVMTTFSGVAANFGGVPLAFAFISTLGTVGAATRFLDNVGIDLYGHGFTLFGFWGLVATYLYFQIPLMILVIAPAIDGLREEWREAAANLGATAWQYWRRVGLPILLPSMLGAMVLLFGGAFAAYATAYALTSGTIELTPLQIGELLGGNVLSDPHQGYALALGMIVVISVAMAIYFVLDRRASRWQRRGA